MVFNPLIRYLSQEYGWRWALRIFGWIQFPLFIGSVLTMRPTPWIKPPPPRADGKKPPLLDLDFFKDPVLRESMVTLLSDAMVDEVGRKALRESPVSEIELQKLAQEKGIEPTNLDALSDLRHRLVRERKERAVKLLLESNQAAREIRFEGDAWSAFKRAHETKRKR